MPRAENLSRSNDARLGSGIDRALAGMVVRSCHVPLRHPLLFFLHKALIVLKIASLLIREIVENQLLGDITVWRHALFLA